MLLTSSHLQILHPYQNSKPKPPVSLSISCCHSQLPNPKIGPNASEPRVFSHLHALVIKTTINSVRLAHWVRCRRPCHQTPVESGPLEARTSRLSLPQHAGEDSGAVAEPQGSFRADLPAAPRWRRAAASRSGAWHKTWQQFKPCP